MTQVMKKNGENKIFLSGRKEGKCRYDAQMRHNDEGNSQIIT